MQSGTLEYACNESFTILMTVTIMKHAIVIGASSGIGREVVLRLIEEGWNVGIAARRQALLEELRSKAPEMVTCREIDVCKDTAPEVLQELIAETGGMELFFYASGIGRKNVDLEPGIELSTVATNGLGFVRMVGEAYRYFSRHGGGHIVCITSVAGTKGLGMAPSYSATKAMQSTYLQALEQQAAFRHLNIRVTDIRPGFVDTELLRGDAHYPLLMNTESVADEIMDAIRHRCHVWIIDWRWRIVTAFWRRLPRWVWRNLRVAIK